MKQNVDNSQSPQVLLYGYGKFWNHPKFWTGRPSLRHTSHAKKKRMKSIVRLVITPNLVSFSKVSHSYLETGRSYQIDLALWKVKGFKFTWCHGMEYVIIGPWLWIVHEAVSNLTLSSQNSWYVLKSPLEKISSAWQNMTGYRDIPYWLQGVLSRKQKRVWYRVRIGGQRYALYGYCLIDLKICDLWQNFGVCLDYSFKSFSTAQTPWWKYRLFPSLQKKLITAKNHFCISKRSWKLNSTVRLHSIQDGNLCKLSKKKQKKPDDSPPCTATIDKKKSPESFSHSYQLIWSIYFV